MQDVSNLSTLPDIQELTTLVHPLVQTQASDMQRVSDVLESLAQHQIITTDVSADSEVELSSTSVQTAVSDGHRESVHFHAAPVSMIRELGNEIPILFNKKYSLWKAHVLAYLTAGYLRRLKTWS